MLNKALRRRGVEVDVFTTNAGLEERPDIIVNQWQQVDGVRVKYFSYKGYIHYNFSMSLWRELRRQVKEYDLVHITAVWNFPVLAAAWACQQAGVPYIVSPRGTIYPETIALKSATLKKGYYYLFARQYLNRAAAIHFTAQDERLRVMSYLKLSSRAVVIPNGLELDEIGAALTKETVGQLPVILEGKRYLLFLGRLHPKKGLDVLIKAYSTIHRQYPEVYLVLAGPDADGYGQVIREQITAANLEENVLFTGMLTGAAKIATLKHAEIFVLSSYSENFGMSVVEAMAVGIPVVISRAVGISAEVEKLRAGVVTEVTPESVAMGVQALLADPVERSSIARNGQQMVSDYFHISAVASAFETLYSTLTC
jgi:glycosyltransferase involved in cell wall biosynthesis